MTSLHLKTSYYLNDAGLHAATIDQKLKTHQTFVSMLSFKSHLLLHLFFYSTLLLASLCLLLLS